MSRLLVCGLCPLPFENTPRNYGPGIRTWQFARGLADAGHEVHLLAMTIDGAYSDEPTLKETVSGVHIERIDHAALMDPRFITRRISAIAPDALIGATIYGSYSISQTEPSLPFWADQFGHVMAEAQAKAALEQDNWPVPHFWPMAQSVGRWCDRLSTVSDRQRYAAIGELGALGRLNAATSGYEFTTTIPCAHCRERVLAETNSTAALAQAPSSGNALRGNVVPKDSFIALWSGGFNVWSDVETIFVGVEASMRTSDTIHFVSTGGGIDGHDLDTYAQFQRLVETSSFKERFHLLGWLDGDRIPGIVAESNVGVLAERPIYEGLLGSKNRIIEWMAGGLPVIYNRYGDIGDILADNDLGMIFNPGDAKEFGELLVTAAGDQDLLASLATRAKSFALREFSFKSTTKDLQTWAKNPTRSPDRITGTAADLPLEMNSLSQDLLAIAKRSSIGKSQMARRLWKRAQTARAHRKADA